MPISIVPFSQTKSIRLSLPEEGNIQLIQYCTGGNSYALEQT